MFLLFVKKAGKLSRRIFNEDFVMKKLFIFFISFISLTTPLFLVGCGKNLVDQDLVSADLKDIWDNYKRGSTKVYYEVVDLSDGFQYLKDGYAKDYIYVFYKGAKVVYMAESIDGGSRLHKRSADAFSFQVLDDGYAKDKYDVFYKGVQILGADIETFELFEHRDFGYIGDRYAKDKKSIYFNGFPLENVDYETFEVLDDGYAKDKNTNFYRGVEISFIADEIGDFNFDSGED